MSTQADTEFPKIMPLDEDRQAEQRERHRPRLTPEQHERARLALWQMCRGWTQEDLDADKPRPTALGVRLEGGPLDGMTAYFPYGRGIEGWQKPILDESGCFLGRVLYYTFPDSKPGTRRFRGILVAAIMRERIREASAATIA